MRSLQKDNDLYGRWSMHRIGGGNSQDHLIEVDYKEW